VPFSIRYFRHHAWVNEYHFFAHENLLKLDGRAEAAMGRYRPAGSTGKAVVLLVVEYGDEETAVAAQETFTAALLPAAESGLQRQGDGSWLGCRRDGDLVIVVADAPTSETATGLVEACALRREHDASRRPR
jgi:hypothetical protein